jgi:hypothetical protein
MRGASQSPLWDGIIESTAMIGQCLQVGAREPTLAFQATTGWEMRAHGPVSGFQPFLVTPSHTHGHVHRVLTAFLAFFGVCVCVLCWEWKGLEHTRQVLPLIYIPALGFWIFFFF